MDKHKITGWLIIAVFALVSVGLLISTIYGIAQGEIVNPIIDGFLTAGMITGLVLEIGRQAERINAGARTEESAPVWPDVCAVPGCSEPRMHDGPCRGNATVRTETGFCPWGDDGEGAGCLKMEGHAGLHMVQEADTND
jgi:hypothetical protein